MARVNVARLDPTGGLEGSADFIQEGLALRKNIGLKWSKMFKKKREKGSDFGIRHDPLTT